ncbi:MAG TPA: DUF192 domain-containing protein [Candidatus Obscuribacterales bacterium]
MANKKQAYFFNESRKTLLASRARIADGFISRAIGLLRHSTLDDGEGMYLTRCNSIHMIGMKFAIDAVFLDKNGVIVAILENFRPGRLSPIYFKAQSCLELPAGKIGKTGTAVGDKVSQGFSLPEAMGLEGSGEAE